MLTSIDICSKAKDLASEKTLYVKGGHGNFLTKDNKLRLSNNDIYNIKRTNIIFAASEDTRAWDEFGFLSAISGYNCRTIGEVVALCDDISKDFSNILPGEIVFLKDSFGIYIGDGKVIALSPNGLGETILDGWVSHGKLPEIQYTEPVLEAPAQEVINDAEGEMDGDIQELVEEEIKPEVKHSEMEMRHGSFRRRH